MYDLWHVDGSIYKFYTTNTQLLNIIKNITNQPISSEYIVNGEVGWDMFVDEIYLSRIKVEIDNLNITSDRKLLFDELIEKTPTEEVIDDYDPLDDIVDDDEIEETNIENTDINTFFEF